MGVTARPSRVDGAGIWPPTHHPLTLAENNDDPAFRDIMSWMHHVLKLMVMMTDWDDLMKEFKVDGDDLILECDLLCRLKSSNLIVVRR